MTKVDLQYVLVYLVWIDPCMNDLRIELEKLLERQEIGFSSTVVYFFDSFSPSI